ncbi:OLC1v1029468C2 [Oldenlandia corymbosa var. corymbosa]|uniref:YTH domain-containing family protein n=1 Tax=Oldenlandia corymbosa var. corymbosa TaxID=529605 RepID=A0AAV1CEY8_OLDCO|nr:OLC1v1029468C2 [Oldenlandia corymbosa var. corymbosa]
MSSDTIKENLSVVDSSVTDWRNDLGNLEGPEDQSHRANVDGCPMGAEEPGIFSEQHQTSSDENKGKPSNTRYFIIKSLNHQNIELSVKKGIWATQVMNEPILEEAFRNCGKVILIFSVNMSGFFQGYAQMMSSIGWRRDNVWSQGGGGNNPWGRTFKVKWLRLYDLPFQKTLHLKNPLNDYKPVKISRDCQELPQDIGQALCELLDGKNDIELSLNRLCRELSTDDTFSRRSHLEPSRSLQVENYVPSMRMGPVMYPSLLYHHQADASRFYGGHQMSRGGNPGNFCGDVDTSAPFNVRGQSAERSPFGSSLTEDDFLDMTYEEYLEAHSRGSKKLYESCALPTSSIKKPAVTRMSSENKQSSSSSKKRPRQRSPR